MKERNIREKQVISQIEVIRFSKFDEKKGIKWLIRHIRCLSDSGKNGMFSWITPKLYYR